MRNFALLGALCAILFATPAFAGSANTFNFGPSSTIKLLESQDTKIGTTAFCVNLLPTQVDGATADNRDAVACGDDDLNEMVWPQNAQVEYIIVRQTIASDANDICDVELEVAGTEVATAQVAMSASALSRTKTELKYNLSDGDAVGISFNTGTSCMTGVTPEVIVELWGHWVDENTPGF